MPFSEKRVRETRAETITQIHVVLGTVWTLKFKNDFFARFAKNWNALTSSVFPQVVKCIPMFTKILNPIL